MRYYKFHFSLSVLFTIQWFIKAADRFYINSGVLLAVNIPSRIFYGLYPESSIIFIALLIPPSWGLLMQGTGAHMGFTPELVITKQ